MDFLQLMLSQNPQALDKLAASSLDPKAFYDGLSASKLQSSSGGLGAALGGAPGMNMDGNGLMLPQASQSPAMPSLSPEVLSSLMQQKQGPVVAPTSPAGGRGLQASTVQSPTLEKPRRPSLAAALGGK